MALDVRNIEMASKIFEEIAMLLKADRRGFYIEELSGGCRYNRLKIIYNFTMHLA